MKKKKKKKKKKKIGIIHIWHAPPNPLGGIGLFAVTYLQKIRGEFPSGVKKLDSGMMDSFKLSNESLKERLQVLMTKGKVPIMPPSLFVPEGHPYKEKKGFFG